MSVWKFSAATIKNIAKERTNKQINKKPHKKNGNQCVLQWHDVVRYKLYIIKKLVCKM